MRRLHCPVLCLLLAVTAAGCAAAPGPEDGLALERIVVDGVERSYYLHVPPGLDTDTAPPLLLALHGGGRGDGRTVAKHVGFNALADRHGFVVAYPNGIDGRWNDGRGVTYRGEFEEDIDDVGFIAALIDRLVGRRGVDPDRVYVTGLSNGGMMTLRLGCEIAPRLAAIAAVIASMPRNIVDGCEPAGPLPVLVMNGTEDPLVPWEGGQVRFLRRTMGEVLSTNDTVRFWARHNGCDPTPERRSLPDRDTDDGSTVTVATWCADRPAREVMLYRIEGGGHTLPGSDIPDWPRLVGRKNGDIDGAAVIRDFLARH